MAAYRVLVVDDNLQVRRMVTASIKTLGAEIDVVDVPSAEEALFISASLPLDLVVLDYRLPGMTGLEMLARLRIRRPETKIILVTGVDDAATRQKVAESGVEAYFYKPIEVTKFLEAVKQALWPSQAEPALPPTAPEAVDISPPTRPARSAPPANGEPGPAAPQGLKPTLDDRLTSLKQQLRAVTVLLVGDNGKVLEVAGNPSQITSDSALLSALMRVFRASLQVSQAMGRGVSTSLQYFVGQRLCLYQAPVGMNHALLAITAGHFEPDKLPAVERAFRSAVQDLQAILASIAAEEAARREEQERRQLELPSQVAVDPQTAAGVERMFGQSAETAGKEQADSFWDSTGENTSSNGAQGKDVLTYDQARELGLAPGEDKPA